MHLKKCSSIQNPNWVSIPFDLNGSKRTTKYTSSLFNLEQHSNWGVDQRSRSRETVESRQEARRQTEAYWWEKTKREVQGRKIDLQQCHEVSSGVEVMLWWEDELGWGQVDSFESEMLNFVTFCKYWVGWSIHLEFFRNTTETEQNFCPIRYYVFCSIDFLKILD